MFRMANVLFEEKDAQVLGISCDSVAAHRAFSSSLGNITYPLLSDFYPHGAMTKTYDLWNDERGTSRRAVIIVDKEGIIRFRETYVPGVLPNPEDILAAIDKLG